jgi:hypothetical protein
MADLKGFSRRMIIIADQIGVGARRAVRKAALAADQALVIETPVDTGRARSNWIVSLGSPATHTIPPYSPGKGLGKDETGNLQAALAQGEMVIAQAQLGDTIWLSNNLLYIDELDKGRSAQTPANFVDDAVKAAARAVRGVSILGRGR